MRVDAGWTVVAAAEAAGVSERTMYKWRARWRAGDHELSDWSSRPLRSPMRTPASVERMIVVLWRLWMTAAEISETPRLYLSKVSLMLKRKRIGKRSSLITRNVRLVIAVSSLRFQS